MGEERGGTLGTLRGGGGGGEGGRGRKEREEKRRGGRGESLMFKDRLLSRKSYGPLMDRSTLRKGSPKVDMSAGGSGNIYYFILLFYFKLVP